MEIGPSLARTLSLKAPTVSVLCQFEPGWCRAELVALRLTLAPRAVFAEHAFGYTPLVCQLPADPREWETVEVMQWLRENGLEIFKSVLYRNAMNGKTLLKLKLTGS